VRLGLSSALDRDAIADDAVEGYVTGAPQSGLILPGFDRFVDPSLPDQGVVTQDVDAALAHFADAGYELDGDRLVDSSGTQLALSITTANGYTDWLRAVQAVEGQLSAVGIDVSIEQPQPAAYQQALATGDFQLAMGAFGGTGSIYDDFNNLLNSSFATPIGETTAANYERFSDPAVDELLNELKVTTDEAQQQQIAYQLQQVMYTQVPTIAMYYGGLWGIFDDSKFTNWPSEDNPYASPKTWDSNVLLIVTNIEPVG
jgi:peptide/nickel transport system substrate-binding protein